jgi:hypothetical protein
MVKVSTIAPLDPRPSAKINERLRAHAGLCRRIASRCWNEDIAQELEQLAQLCLSAADTSGKAPPRH